MVNAIFVRWFKSLFVQTVTILSSVYFYNSYEVSFNKIKKGVINVWVCQMQNIDTFATNA